jgi:hypothetical protein
MRHMDAVGHGLTQGPNQILSDSASIVSLLQLVPN